ncbi:hypothetical protein CFAM422_008308 [Trichoderma lentiforme]|uniref:Uncharacterized protein n=1 Tax=Trichoderma lentiforme TaxID=1567552 RepID=A0A9P4XBC4_9HYPO|nr:hypothetical protein CFAM422_008308 [Trichoderma lentiforme]
MVDRGKTGDGERRKEEEEQSVREAPSQRRETESERRSGLAKATGLLSRWDSTGQRMQVQVQQLGEEQAIAGNPAGFGGQFPPCCSE